METTRLSTKGLPKNQLRPTGRFPDADLAEVAGCLRSKGKSKTPAQMRAAIGREVMRRQDCGRY
jgi:hypothetical protein